MSEKEIKEHSEEQVQEEVVVEETPSVPEDLTSVPDQAPTLSWRTMRQGEYGDLNQFELLSDDAINGTNKYAEAILAIKAKYPKPSE